MEADEFQAWLADFDHLCEDLLGVWDEVTPDQQSAVRDALARIVQNTGLIERGEARPRFPHENALDGRLLTLPDGTILNFRDVTEHNRLLLEDLRQKQLLEQLIEQAPIGIVILRAPEYRIELANSFQQQVLWQGKGETVGRTLQELFPEAMETIAPILDGIVHTGAPFQATDLLIPLTRENGILEAAYFTVTYLALQGMEGSVDRILAITQETTLQVKVRQQLEMELAERRRVETELRHSEERFRLTLSNSPTFVYHTDSELRYTWVYNLPGGADPQMMIGKLDTELLPAEAVTELVAFKRRVLESGKGDRAEIHIPLPDGERIYDISAEPLWDSDGYICGLTVAATEIAEMLHARERAQADRVWIEIQRRLLDQREQERLKIARDIHDGPVQELTAASLALKGLSLTGLPAEIRQEMDAVRLTLQRQISELRNYAQELRPPTLASFGLEKTIRSHLENYQEKYPGVQVDFRCELGETRLPDDTRLVLFRIYQETLTNIAKHSQARRVKIHAWLENRDACLEIQDDGIGFSMREDLLELAREGHLGLVGMRERAEAIGAWLEINSHPGGGTTIRVVAPLGSL